MHRSVSHRLTLRTAIALTICIALLPIPSISLLVSGAAQGQSEERKGKPKPGKPEGVFPDLENLEFPTPEKYPKKRSMMKRSPITSIGF